MKSLSKNIPLVIITAWITLVSGFVWKRVAESPQPPFYDAISYIQKAKSFWDNAARGWHENPLNLVQAVRPPGTVLLSYPFGFSEEYKGFLFRSVVMPFILWIMAILIASWPRNPHPGQRSYWPVLSAVFLLGPMPFFFQFECPSAAYWGLVDGFLASLAALAVACSFRSLLNHSKVWVILAALVASFCPLVKPAGSMVLLFTAMMWIGVATLPLFQTRGAERRRKFNFLLFGIVVFALAGGTISWLCLHSQYLSDEVIAFYKQCMVILRREYGTSLTFPIFKGVVFSIFGPQVFVMLLLGGAVFFVAPASDKLDPPAWVMVFVALLLCIGGGWFWISASGVSLVRYFYPFALMMIVPLIFMTFRKIHVSLSALPVYFRFGASLLCTLPALNLVCLLVVANPNEKWQEFSGVSMHIGSGREGVELGRELLTELNHSNKPATVYTISQSMECYSFNCYGWYQNVIHPETNYYSTVLPVDWHRPSSYRFSEIIAADYILCEPVTKSPAAKGGIDKEISTLNEEEIVLDDFFSTISPMNGISVFRQTGHCRLYRISDKTRLRDTLSAFIKTKAWRPVFIGENREFFKEKETH